MAIHLALKFIMDKPRSKSKFKKILNEIYSNFYHLKDKEEEDHEAEIEDKTPFEFLNEELHSNWCNLTISSCDLFEGMSFVASTL